MPEHIQFTVKELRARKNLTQRQVADALGVSLPTYSAWEKNISGVGVSKVEALAQFHGVTLNDIFLPDT